MASYQPNVAAKLLDDNDPRLLLHRDILELSKAINSMEMVVRSVDGVDLQAENDADTQAAFASLAASLGKLKQAFETLYRYGDFGLERGTTTKWPS